MDFIAMHQKKELKGRLVVCLCADHGAGAERDISPRTTGSLDGDSPTGFCDPQFRFCYGSVVSKQPLYIPTPVGEAYVGHRTSESKLVLRNKITRLAIQV